MTKRHLLTLFTVLFLSSTLWAVESHDCGAYLLRHRVIASESLSPESIEMLNISTGPSVGVISIMLLKKNTLETLSGRVHVVIKRVSGLMQTLKLRKIETQKEAIFYAAEFLFAADEKIKFELSASALGQPPQTFTFSQTLP